MADELTSSITGVDALNARLGRILKQIVIHGDEGLRDVAFDLMGKSQAIVPHETGDLEGNAYAESRGAGQWETGYASPYAVRQHEELDYQHEPGREAKYLEKPFKANIKQYQQHIADEYKKALAE